MRQDVLRNTGSRIGNFDRQCSDPGVDRLDGDSPAGRLGVDGVLHEIEHQLFHKTAVADHRTLLAIDIEGDFNSAFFDLGFEQGYGPPDNEADAFLLEFLPTGPGVQKKISDNALAVIGIPKDFFYFFLEVRVTVQFLIEHFSGEHDRPKGCIELVGDSSGDLADRGHFFGLGHPPVELDLFFRDLILQFFSTAENEKSGPCGQEERADEAVHDEHGMDLRQREFPEEVGRQELKNAPSEDR